ncbi:hypothetical protein BaRGS_00017593, partial [Batillaria attramentaria]
FRWLGNELYQLRKTWETNSPPFNHLLNDMDMKIKGIDRNWPWPRRVEADMSCAAEEDFGQTPELYYEPTGEAGDVKLKIETSDNGRMETMETREDDVGKDSTGATRDVKIKKEPSEADDIEKMETSEDDRMTKIRLQILSHLEEEKRKLKQKLCDLFKSTPPTATDCHMLSPPCSPRDQGSQPFTLTGAGGERNIPKQVALPPPQPSGDSRNMLQVQDEIVGVACCFCEKTYRARSQSEIDEFLDHLGSHKLNMPATEEYASDSLLDEKESALRERTGQMETREPCGPKLNYSHLKTYFQFCITQRVTPFPPEEKKIRNFIMHVRELKPVIQSSSIEGYTRTINQAWNSIVPTVTKRYDKNIRSLYKALAMDERKGQNRQTKGTTPCNYRKCTMCRNSSVQFICPETSVRGPRGAFVIEGCFSCSTVDVVYLLYCAKCGKMYVGETETFMYNRFQQHLDNIRRGKTSSELQACLLVHRHFTHGEHAGVENLRMMILWSKSTDDPHGDRKDREKYFIDLLGTRHPDGFNQKG